MKKDKKNKKELRLGDKVWWYNPEAVWTIININQTHAHIRNVHGVLEWVAIEKLYKADNQVI